MRMKNFSLFLIVVSILMLFPGCGCNKVPAGNVGIRVFLLGSSKGVDTEELGVGRYWIGLNEELYIFPTFKQNVVWTKDPTEGSPNDESITFQTSEGMVVGADIGITYQIDPRKVSNIFQKYRRGVEEITDIFLRNKVRDTFNMVSSSYKVESIYGEGKVKLLKEVNEKIKNDLQKEGILIEKVYLVERFRLPETVVKALNLKIEATQRAEQRENELREAQAEAKKIVALAKAEADAIKEKSKAITTTIIKYEAIKKWDGKLPHYNGGGAVPFLEIK